MAFQTLCMVLLSSVALSAAQSCGSPSCSQVYGANCPPDKSTALYDNSMTTKSTCNSPIGPAGSLSAKCYDTCVKGHPFVPSIPVQCCASLINAPEVMNVQHDPKTSVVVVDIFPPAGASNSYHLNKFCKYNVQCPNEDYNLHYTVVRFNVEPPDGSGQCLDFLRYHFTATGTHVTEDACGTKEKLSDVVLSGYHGSGLSLDFRSNRIHSKDGFYLGITCTLPSQAHKKRATYSQTSCSLSQNLRSRQNTNKPISAKEFFNEIFPGSFRSRLSINVTRGSVVKYKSRMIVVEHKGRILRRFRGIRMLRVHNRIEGYLNFIGSSSPSGRTFPGYGYLRVGWTGIVQYVQTLVDPMYLLSDEEEETVRQLFEEHYNRIKLGYDDYDQLAVNCNINTLAELNIASCSEVVRAVANFFLKTDRFQKFCYRR